MSPIIPEVKLLEIKEAAPIAEVIGQYVRLNQRGRYLVGLCPFHAEKTPSFTVYPERNIFHCFGCGAGGNVFTFLMQHLRLSFPEAVADLAQKYGIPVQWQKAGNSAQVQANRQRQGFYEVNELAAEFFEKKLAQTPQGDTARQYLARRGLPEAVAKAYRLGYAPDEWRSLTQGLSGQRANLEAALQVGLITARAGGGHYDRFRGRLIFPIVDVQGRVIAFGGRIIGQGEPKYLNSPESQLYSKGRNLYGLYQAREAIRKKNIAILVERYMDLLALRSRGIEPVVATLGTALTREQVRLLKGYTSRVVLVFDADAAGLKAMQRTLPLFAAERLPVRVLTLPAGEDPDSYATTHGVEIFVDPWDQAQPLFGFILDQAVAGAGDGMESTLAVFESLKPYFQGEVDPLERSLWLQMAAKRLGAQESVLEASLESRRPAAMPVVKTCQEETLSFETRFIKLLLTYPEVLSKFDLEQYLDQFRHPEMQIIAQHIHACYQQVGYLDHSLLVTQIEEDAICRRICALALAGEEYQLENFEAELEDYTRNMEVRRLKREVQELQEKMTHNHKTGKGGDSVALATQWQDLRQRLKNLQSS